MTSKIVNKKALQGLVNTGIIAFSIAVSGGVAWKINVHDKQMNTIDNFYKAASAAASKKT